MSMKPFQFLELPRKLPRAQPIELRVAGWNEVHGAFAGEEAAEQAGRCIDCGNPWCEWQCPLHNRIPNWLALVREGRLFEAATLVHETNPLPEVCGRVCPQDRLCEGACTLEDGFGAVTIGAIEKHVVDEAFRQGWRPDLSAVRATGKRVAIVGAGPAGLACADALARRGIEAHVFDRYEEIGGLLTFGIPPFKLEKHVVATRRGVLEHMGVRFELGCEVDAARFGELERDFDSMFLATGAYAYVEAQLPGIDLDGVVPALPFLVANARRVHGTTNADELPVAGWSRRIAIPDVRGRRVVVLGGGDTAMDCVRTAVRLGASEVTCAYRRGEADMPGSRREVGHARDEGVRFAFDHLPREITGTRGVTGVRFDSGGLPADIVIVAFGFRADPPAWLLERGVAVDDSRRIVVGGSGRLPFETSVPGLFAGGDATRGADLVVTAVADGRDAAAAIARCVSA